MFENKTNKTEYDSSEEFIEKFSTNDASPSPAFLESLESQVINEFEGNSTSSNNFIRKLTMALSKKNMLIGSGVLSLVLVVGIGFMVARPFLNKSINDSNIASSENLDLNTILAKVVARNSANGSSQNKLAAPQSESSLAADSAASSYYDFGYNPYGWEDYNYSTYTTEYTPGASYDICPSYGYNELDENITVEYTSFWDDQGTFLGKDIAKTESGEIITLNVTNTEGSYTYYGGNYAVFEKIDYQNYTDNGTYYEDYLTEEYPVTEEGVLEPEYYDEGVTEEPYDAPKGEEPSPTDYFGDFFGNDVKLIGKETINGKDAYVLEWSYENGCYSYLSTMDSIQRVDSSDEILDIINRTWVDSDTFEYLKQEYYVNSVSPKDLIVTQTSRSTVKTAELAEVESEFTFDAGVKVQEIKFPNYTGDQSTDATLDLIEAKGYPMFLAKGALEINSVYTSAIYDVVGSDYLNDRSFYIKGVIGDTMYKLFNFPAGEEYISSLVSMSYNTSDYNVYMNIEVYPAKTEVSKIINSYAGTYGEQKKSKGTVKVDGRSYSADVYTVTYDYSEELAYSDTTIGSTEPGRSIEDVTVESSTSTYYIFEFNGYTVLAAPSTTLPELEGVTLGNTHTKSEVKGLLPKNEEVGVDYYIPEIVENKLLPISN